MQGLRETGEHGSELPAGRGTPQTTPARVTSACTSSDGREVRWARALSQMGQEHVQVEQTCAADTASEEDRLAGRAGGAGVLGARTYLTAMNCDSVQGE